MKRSLLILSLLVVGAGCSKPSPATLRYVATYKGAPLPCGDLRGLSLEEYRSKLAQIRKDYREGLITEDTLWRAMGMVNDRRLAGVERGK